MKNEYLFKRKEKKYLLEPDKANAFKEALFPYLEPETGKDGSPVSWRRSYYFESPDFKSYFDHRSRQDNRFKIRMRFYNAKEKIPNSGFMEMKMKNKGETLKKRFKFDLDVVRAFLKSENWEEALMHVNADFDRKSLVEISNEITQTLERLKMQPVLFALYGRECLQDKQNGIRITFDSDLYFQATRNDFITPERNMSFGPKNKIIMEIKTSQKKPTWLNRLTDRFELKSESFSKYCYGVEALYLDYFNQHKQIVENEFTENKGVLEDVGIDNELLHYFQID